MQANSTPAEFFRAISPWLFSYRFFLQPEPLATVLTLIAGNPFPQTAASFGRQADAIIGHDTRSRAGTIRVPTHVIVGTEDILTPPSHSRALAAAIPGATLTEVQGVGHAIHSEQPGAFTRAVIDFLRR
jgi:pimeloyl-ACP methyl ester carboxylesterase